jgi:hypothetical protein
VALAVKALSQFARVSTSVGYAHAEHPSSRNLPNSRRCRSVSFENYFIYKKILVLE